MKKGRILAIAIVVLMVVGALVMASCGGCPGDYDGSTNCRHIYGSASYYQCTNNCISRRGTVYIYDSTRRCDCV